MRGKPTFYGSRKPPGKDSPRARADATWHLINCAVLPDANWLANQKNLKLPTAEAMLAAEVARRASHAPQ